uniref:Uncharacterized protein n=1 Tax=Physcomitrium patens TaxID=3218 RepID=A0A2K1JPV6_PHYPA|nr:hypothetical protein PHYPA_015949 [Physcomitrium patens]
MSFVLDILTKNVQNWKNLPHSRHQALLWLQVDRKRFVRMILRNPSVAFCATLSRLILSEQHSRKPLPVHLNHVKVSAQDETPSSSRLLQHEAISW